MSFGRWLSSLLGRRSGRAGEVVPLHTVRPVLDAADIHSAPRLVAHPLMVGERGPMAAALARAQLPTGDIDEPSRLFWRFDTVDDVPVGFGGLEICGDAALLHSIVTLPPVRDRGIGSAIVEALETEAALHLCRDCYLLTSEVGFFERLGYASCDPVTMPKAIRDAKSFATRPASMLAMSKRL